MLILYHIQVSLPVQELRQHTRGHYMTRRRGTQRRKPEDSDIYTLVHQDLNKWIVDTGRKRNWDDRFIELALRWAAMVSRGRHPERKVRAVEGALANLSRSAQHRGGFKLLKDGFKDTCNRHENRRGKTILYGQHRYKRLFPSLFGTRRQRRQLQTSH